MNGVIVAENVLKHFYPARFLFFRKNNQPIIACDDISLRIPEGKIVGLIGPNGAGKTTFLKILAGLIIPDQGKVFIRGLDMAKEDHRAKETIGAILSENKGFYLRLTGRENLRLFAAFYNLSKKAAEDKIEELSSLLKLDDSLDKMFQENSSGIRQRFAVARGLLSDAPVLLLDEPTKNLDPAISAGFLAYLGSERDKKRKTVLLTGHHLSEMTAVAGEIAVLDKGRIKAFGTLSGLKEASGCQSLEQVYKFYTKEGAS